MSLKQKTISNVKWSFIESISLKASGFVLSIILARLLLPEDFGLLAVVNVFYLLVTLFIDGGLKEALIQKKNATEVHYSSVFWMNLLIAVILYLLLFIAAPYIEGFYEYENLGFYIRLQSLTLILESFGIIQIAKATKELNLKKVTKARIPASLISFGVGIFLAYQGYGILSLIIQQLVNTSLYVLFLLISVRYIPKLLFNHQEIKEMYKFGLKILSVSLISRFYVQSLNLIYAKFYTPQLLGLNNKAVSIQNTPIELVNSTFMKGVYPTYVVLQNNVNKLQAIYLLNVRILFLIMILINGIFFFTAEELILLLLGKNWLGSVVYLKIVAAGSLFYPITVQSQNIFKVRNKLDSFLKMELLNKAILLGLVFGLISYLDFPKLLILVMFVNLIFAVIYFTFVGNELNFKTFRELIHLSLRLLIFTILGFSFYEIISKIFSTNRLLIIISFSTTFAVSWGLVIWIFDKNLKSRIKHILKKSQL